MRLELSADRHLTGCDLPANIESDLLVERHRRSGIDSQAASVEWRDRWTGFGFEGEPDQTEAILFVHIDIVNSDNMRDSLGIPPFSAYRERLVLVVMRMTPFAPSDP